MTATGSAAPTPQEQPPRRLRLRTAAKINWTLRIRGRRADGYHELDSLVLPVSLFDTLTVAVEKAHGRPPVRLDATPEPCAPERNLAVRAARLFLDRTAVEAAVRIRLDKEIPWGAGLGGGSSDAAAVLVALDRLLDTRLGTAQLAAWGAELGADVPFFVWGTPARIRGAGEIVTPCPAPRPLSLVVAAPAVSLATADVYRAWDRRHGAATLTSPPAPDTSSLLARGEEAGLEEPCNDLREVAQALCPEIEALAGLLAGKGAERVGMSGSGSAVFGTCESSRHAESIAEELRKTGCWARSVTTLPSVRRFDGPPKADRPA